MTNISVYELSYYLQIKPRYLIDFIKHENLTNLLNKRKVLLTDAKFLVDTYRLKNNIPIQLWEIPDWLSPNNTPWMDTLLSMYMEGASFPASLSPSQGKQIQDIIFNIHPKVVVEIGCFIGISSIWIAAALKELGQGHLHSIDLFKPKMPNKFNCCIIDDPLSFAEISARKSQVSKYISFYKMSSSVFATKYINKVISKPIDFLFIDGDHSIGGCLSDFINFYPYIKEGGYILLHDIYPENCGWNGPRYVIDNYIKKSDFFEIEEIGTSPNYGMALIKKLKNDPSFHPFKSIRIEKTRQIHHLKTTFGYSFFYQLLKHRLLSILACLK